MSDRQIRFEDGAAYERMMGTWSRLVGEEFLDWLRPAAGLDWVDVGCGNGAFTQLLVERCAPASVQGVDPSPAQLDFARGRGLGGQAEFRSGDAMALPFPDGAFDAAVMALVLFFVPDAPKGFAEMVRVVRPGGIVAAYVWDIHGGGLPIEAMNVELRAIGIEPLLPPSHAVSRLPALEALWRSGGLETVETRTIAVERDFADFDELWAISTAGSALGQGLERMDPEKAARVKEGSRARLSGGGPGPVRVRAQANAVKGRAPG
jgi:SAM-dependent methyltransferase